MERDYKSDYERLKKSVWFLHAQKYEKPVWDIYILGFVLLVYGFVGIAFLWLPFKILAFLLIVAGLFLTLGYAWHRLVEWLVAKRLERFIFYLQRKDFFLNKKCKRRKDYSKEQLERIDNMLKNYYCPTDEEWQEAFQVK